MMTQEHPPRTGEWCRTCNRRIRAECYGNHWKLTCDCGETPIKFGRKTPEGWTA